MAGINLGNVTYVEVTTPPRNVPFSRIEENMSTGVAHEKTPNPLEPPSDPRHRPTVGS